MKKYIITLLILASFVSNVACQPIRTVQVKVVGDDAKPIEGAKVIIGFYGYQPHQSIIKEEITDENGVAKASGKPILAMITRVTKEGY